MLSPVKKRSKQAAAEPRGEAVITAPGTDALPRIERMLRRHATWIVVALVLVSTARILSTYTTLSHTFDEPAHIACGMEWLEKHAYQYEAQHPPLTRVMTALLPRLFGSHGHAEKGMWDEGLAILFASGSEDTTLMLARAGILPFFWLACWLTYSCTRWIAGTTAAIVAVFLVTMMPAMLAHAGLATTDMGLTAMLWLAIYTGWRWTEEPTMRRAVAFGASTGGAVLAKFSTLAFFPAIMLFALLFWLIGERPTPGTVVRLLRERLPQLGVAIAVAVVSIWAGYLFSFGRPPDFAFSVPAPELFRGIEEVRKHDASGHLTYLMGSVNTVGWPSFYVVALGVKTPLPALGLGLLGAGLMLFRKFFGTRGWIVPGVILGVLVFSSYFTQIKIGTRHVLPVYVAFAMAGGCAAVWLLRRVNSSAIALGLAGVALASVAVSSVAAHPDYIGYFNVLAGGKPEEFLIDSDLDWGQDTKRLAKRLKEVGAIEVYFNQFAPGNFQKLYGFPPVKPLDVNGPKPGWNAVSITPMKLGLFGDTRYAYDAGFHFWPQGLQPVERIGKGILLFHVNP